MILKQCPDCLTLSQVPCLGVNPWDLMPNHIWQIDVTHYSEFGKLKYIHVCIDICSGLIFASLHTGEASRNVIDIAYRLLLLWDCLKSSRQIMALLILETTLYNFVRNLELNIKLEFLIIHGTRNCWSCSLHSGKLVFEDRKSTRLNSSH